METGRGPSRAVRGRRKAIRERGKHHVRWRRVAANRLRRQVQDIGRSHFKAGDRGGKELFRISQPERPDPNSPRYSKRGDNAPAFKLALLGVNLQFKKHDSEQFLNARLVFKMMCSNYYCSIFYYPRTLRHKMSLSLYLVSTSSSPGIIEVVLFQREIVPSRLQKLTSAVR